MKDSSGDTTPVTAVAGEKDVAILEYAERAAEPVDADVDAEKAVAAPVDPPEAAPAALDIGPPPDGGALAWMTVGGSFLATLATFGITNAYGVFQAYYAQNQLKGYNNSTISWIGAIQQFLLFFNGVSATPWSAADISCSQGACSMRSGARQCSSRGRSCAP